MLWEICCIAQETQTGALYEPKEIGWGGKWEGSSKGWGYMYTYGWFMLRSDRKQNSVKQISFKEKKELLWEIDQIHWIIPNKIPFYLIKKAPWWWFIEKLIEIMSL